MMSSNQQKKEKLGIQAAKGVAWISVEMIGSQFASFIVFVAISRYLSPLDIGLIGISYIIVQALQASIINNITIIVSKEQNPTDTDFDTTFWISVCVSIMCFLIVNGLSSLYSYFVANSKLIDTIHAMSFVILFYGLARPYEAWFTRFFQFKTLAFRGISASIISGSIGVLLAVNGHGVYSVVIQQILSLVISFLLMHYSCAWKPSLRFSKTTATKILAMYKGLLPSSITYTINQNLDSVLIGSFFGLTIVGYYTVAKRIRLAAQLVCFSPIKGVILSSLAEIQNDPERLKNNFLKGLLILATIMLPIFILLSLLSKDIIVMFFGKVWLPAGTFLAFLAIANLFTSLIFYVENLFLIKSKPALNNISSIGYTILMGILFVVMPASVLNISIAILLPYFIIFPIVLSKACNLIGLPKSVTFKYLFENLIVSLLLALITYIVFYFEWFVNDLIRMCILGVLLPPIYYQGLKHLAPTSFLALQSVLTPIFNKFFSKGHT